jgi:cysteine desulfurase/selenocysteine lyase
MIDVNKVREQFSIYTSQPDLVYLDSAATSLTPDKVVDEMTMYYKEYRATVHRTAYKNGERADRNYNASREKIAKFINAEVDEVIFTKGTTAGINSLSRALLSNLNPGDEVLVSELEHHSNLLPWREYRKDIELKYVELDQMSITLDGIKNAITDKTKIVSINHVSNIIGETVDIAAIGTFLKSKNIIFVVDGAQAITHEVVDVKALNCDFYVFSAHKLFGPTSLGVLYGRHDLLSKLVFDYGGDMAAIVSKEHLAIKELPVGLEAGTPSIAEVIGFGHAIDFVNEIGMDAIAQHVHEIKKYAVEKLSTFEQITMYNEDVLGSTLAFNINGYPVHDALALYATHGICMRGGHMCNYLTINKLNVAALLRVSFNIYNNKNDIDEFIKATKIILEGDELSWMDF